MDCICSPETILMVLCNRMKDIDKQVDKINKMMETEPIDLFKVSEEAQMFKLQINLFREDFKKYLKKIDYKSIDKNR